MRSPNHMAPARPAPTRHLLVEIALGLAVIVLAALLLFRPGAAEPAPENSSPRAEESAPSPASASAEKSAPESLVIRLHGMEETTELRFAPGELFVPPEAPLEGYTFLRWQNASGEAVPAAGITASRCSSSFSPSGTRPAASSAERAGAGSSLGP